VTAANAQAHVLKDAAGHCYVMAVNADTLNAQKITVRIDRPAGSRSMEIERQLDRKLIQADQIGPKLIWSDTLAPGDGALYAVR
jgi:hypothetical protein